MKSVKPSITTHVVRFVATTLVASAVLSAANSDESSDRAVRLAREALAEHVGASAAKAEVDEVVAVNWPDSSLGCAEAGLLYTPAVVAGHRVVLKLGGSVYAVHVGGGRAVLCGAGKSVDHERESEAARRPGGDTEEALTGLKLAQQAERDLAARLKLPRDRVTIVFYRPTSWPDAGLGCAAPAATYPPQPTRGFRIQLRAGERAYEFHSDRSRLVECPPPDPQR